MLPAIVLRASCLCCNSDPGHLPLTCIASVYSRNGVRVATWFLALADPNFLPPVKKQIFVPLAWLDISIFYLPLIAPVVTYCPHSGHQRFISMVGLSSVNVIPHHLRQWRVSNVTFMLILLFRILRDQMGSCGTRDPALRKTFLWDTRYASWVPNIPQLLLRLARTLPPRHDCSDRFPDKVSIQWELLTKRVHLYKRIF